MNDNAETRSWLSFDTSKSERTYSPGGSSRGDSGDSEDNNPVGLDDPDLDEFHSPQKFGDVLSMVGNEPHLHPRQTSFDESEFLRSKPPYTSNSIPSSNPPPPVDVLPDAEPQILRRLSSVDTDAGDELTSTSVSLFAPNWWDRMDDGKGFTSTPLHPSATSQHTPPPPTTPSQVLHDLYPNHKFPTLNRTESQSSDLLLQTATDEFVLLVGEGKDSSNDNAKESSDSGNRAPTVDTGAGDDVVDEEVATATTSSPPKQQSMR
ncbi:hypothetical protein TrRE_jg884 [Triparma retinervis]|jgi:hypothetical protein|uniref:Uncharacterized protein n=1 Tax=Triparma retinervis TaxID=2557542 RepID=A0A9W7E725_9STRA|nr:hypothetical protein TrRE_jg884 [Triparma retinervis]